MQFRNGVFVITEESHCPLYNAREELDVKDGHLSLPVGKVTCLVLAKNIFEITSTVDSRYERYSQSGVEKTKFECGGCKGIIRFEYKKEKGFATMQMKLLAATQRREKIKKVDVFAGLLRTIDIFTELSNDDILDLATLLELNEYPWQFPIAQKGDPGNRLFIIISGKAEVIDDHGISLAELRRGDVFGEMGLLSGERVTATIMAVEPTQIAIMNQKNFKHIITRFPSLQVFFYKLLVSRITKMNLQRAEELSSGMVGQLSDLSAVELCQMVNSNQKTGTLHIDFDEVRAKVSFNEGELVLAELNEISGEDAFFNILALEQGRFKFTQGLEYGEMELDVIGGFMSMLLEGLKRMDEKN